MERVVITGMGAITPVGNDVPSFWESLKTGKCGIGPITKFDVSDFKVKLGAEVKDFDPTQYMEKREARRADANVHYAMAAAVQAVEQAGLKEGNFDPYRTGVIFGSGVGGLHVAEQEVPKLLEKGPGRVSPFAIPEMIANTRRLISPCTSASRARISARSPRARPATTPSVRLCALSATAIRTLLSAAARRTALSRSRWQASRT